MERDFIEVNTGKVHVVFEPNQRCFVVGFTGRGAPRKAMAQAQAHVLAGGLKAESSPEIHARDVYVGA